ncbi:unnamed protein product [Dovyalis caffra]|uniref:MADS-box domain-containing protein n=1 Tax=Dovyalis caffra TaxID=77055 RepID=A0AAV1S8R5_9ROSI|nr:unnamed protein product [Dovyalis caffra]
MTRRKIKIDKIENEDSRKVTFSKRRSGLFRKARKLCTSHDAQIAVVTFSLAGKLFSFGLPSVDSVVDRFLGNETNSSSSSSNESSRDNEHRPSSSSKGSIASKERQSWRALPIEGMDLDVDELQQYKASLEVLKSNVANQLEEIKDRQARTRDFIGLIDAP